MSEIIYLHKICFFFGTAYQAWVKFDKNRDRFSGRWAINDDGTMYFEIEHSEIIQKGFFFQSQREEVHTAWYEETNIKFQQIFDCSSNSNS